MNEQDAAQKALYNKLYFTEFLEFIARISEKWMEETEMASIDLRRKIEYFLENLLLHHGMKVVYQERFVQEFSDSDDDY